MAISSPPMPRDPRRLIVLSLAFAASSCSLTQVEEATGIRPTVQGDIVWRVPDGSQVAFADAECVSGDRASFRGVDLIAPGWVLRVAADPLEGIGAAVIRRDDGGRHVFRAADCSTLSGDVQRTGWQVNDVWDVSGHLAADCRLDSGAELVGEISFTHCH